MRTIKQFGMITAVLGMMSVAVTASAQSKPADADNFYKSGADFFAQNLK